MKRLLRFLAYCVVAAILFSLVRRLLRTAFGLRH